MDSNSKLGHEYIPNGPHPISLMSLNGKILSAILERHALIVANGSEHCTGRITRQRTTKQRLEESCIDVVLLSSDMMNHFKSLMIDEQRKHVLTRNKTNQEWPSDQTKRSECPLIRVHIQS